MWEYVKVERSGLMFKVGICLKECVKDVESRDSYMKEFSPAE